MLGFLWTMIDPLLQLIVYTIVFTYILQAPEGLRLPEMLSNIISVIATVIVTALFIKYTKGKKSSE